MAARPSGKIAPQTEGSSDPDVSISDGQSSGRWRERVKDRSMQQARQRSLERGQTFIDAALKLIRESDGDDFTLQQIADLTNQSLRTFYQLFASKSDLLLAVFEEEVKVHAKTLRAAVDRQTDPLDRIAAFVITGAEIVETTAVASSELVTFARYRLRLSASHPEGIAAVQEPVVALARELLHDAIEAGALPPIAVDHYAYILVTLKSAYLHSQILGNELGVELPSSTELAMFCLGGLNPQLTRAMPRP